MFRYGSLIAGLVLLALLLGASSPTAAALAQGAGPQTAAGTAFTYQGQLSNASGPLSAVCNMGFGLYDAASDGVQVASTTLYDVPVVDGIFTVSLDFGASAFNGDARWLAVSVRCGSDTTYTPLTGRQPISPAPYATYALTAGSVAWSGLSGVPAGLSDGDDNTTYTAGDGLALASGQFTAQGSAYANVVVVAKSGGDFDTIQAALNSITDAGPTNRYLVWVGPGTYTEQVTTKRYVDIEGAGEQLTTISYAGSDSDLTATVVGRRDVELRWLSVVNTGGAAFATAIRLENTTRLTHVTASASGGSENTGVFSVSAAPIMSQVTARASGGNFSYGVYNLVANPRMSQVTASASNAGQSMGVYNYSSSPTMSQVTADASGGSQNYGVFNQASSPMMSQVTASASGGDSTTGVFNYMSSPTMTVVTASASGGGENTGVANTQSAAPTMSQVIASAWGLGTSSNMGVYNSSASTTMSEVTASAAGGSSSYGVYNVGSSVTMIQVVASAREASISYGVYNTAGGSGQVLYIDRSTLTGVSASLYNNVGYNTRVGGSQLVGGLVNSGAVFCVASYDGNYAALTGACTP